MGMNLIRISILLKEKVLLLLKSFFFFLMGSFVHGPRLEASCHRHWSWDAML
jgi:hypothetical protein